MHNWKEKKMAHKQYYCLSLFIRGSVTNDNDTSWVCSRVAQCRSMSIVVTLRLLIIAKSAALHIRSWKRRPVAARPNLMMIHKRPRWWGTRTRYPKPSPLKLIFQFHRFRHTNRSWYRSGSKRNIVNSDITAWLASLRWISNSQRIFFLSYCCDIVSTQRNN